jgi:hypothetical protein
MKKILGSAVKWFTSGGVKTVVDGIEVVGKNKVNKKKIALVVTILLGILVLTGAISEETFVKLFSEVN